MLSKWCRDWPFQDTDFLNCPKMVNSINSTTHWNVSVLTLVTETVLDIIKTGYIKTSLYGKTLIELSLHFAYFSRLN